MIRVLKFGGTSVATTEKINEIAKYLHNRVKQSEKLIVVASAMGKETDELLTLANKVTSNIDGRELDQLLTTGEIRTVSLMAMCLNGLGTKALSLTADQVGIKVKGDYQNARIEKIDINFIEEKLKEYDILVISGFQGVNSNHELVTLGRGGSDTTAVAIAGTLGVECEIYTDVDGIYATDPRICPNAKKLDKISYEEMNELSSLGANVMHNRSISIASKYNIDVYVAKTLSNEKGTLITGENMLEKNEVTAIATESQVLSISIRFETGSDIDKLVINMVTENKINIDMISQVYFKKETNFAFTCNKEDYKKIEDIIKVVKSNEKVKNIQINEYAKLSMVGTGMRDTYGVVGRVFKTLSDNNVDYYQVTTSEISITILIEKEKLQKAVNCIMEQFELTR